MSIPYLFPGRIAHLCRPLPPIVRGPIGVTLSGAPPALGAIAAGRAAVGGDDDDD